MSAARMQSATPYAPAARSAQLYLLRNRSTRRCRKGGAAAELAQQGKAPMQVLPLPLHVLLISMKPFCHQWRRQRTRARPRQAAPSSAKRNLSSLEEPLLVGIYLYAEDEVAEGASEFFSKEVSHSETSAKQTNKARVSPEETKTLTTN